MSQITESISILQTMGNCDNLPMDVFEIIKDMQINSVLEKHTSAITPPTTPNGRWQTYIKDESGKRVKITSTTEKGLREKLYKHYAEEEETLCSLYPTWIELRYEQGINPRTIKRNQNHWDKYYADNPIVKVKLSKLTSEQIEKYLYEVIREFQITSKELSNMKLIISDMLKLAKKRQLIAYNPMIDVDVKLNGCKPPQKKNDSSRFYYPDEKDKLFEALIGEISDFPERTDAYAIFLLFKTGLRIGEIVALKWSDIDSRTNELHVHRMESLGELPNKKLRSCIVEYTKKKSVSGDRFIYLSEYEMTLLGAVRSINERNGYREEDFIFCDENGRTNIRSLDNLIRKCCRKAGIEEKSAHDIRRTVASEMFSNGVPVEVIREYLGHSDIKTTYGYILNNKTKLETQRMIIASLENLNGLKRTQLG